MLWLSSQDESAQSLELQLEVSTNSEQLTKERAEEEEELDVVNTQYEDQTMETTDPDLIINGVEDLKPICSILSACT